MLNTRSARFFAFLAAGVMAFAASLALPDTAYAWGPGAHMVMGDWLLSNLSLLPLAVTEPLARFPGFFLHGCLSADIFIGKGSVAKKGHSHNWESGYALLARAKSARSRAYAYGYLSHLAADTVAHNVFVPSLMAFAPGNGRMAHVYLEMQADRMVAWDSGQALASFRERGSGSTANMLRKTLRRNAIKFRLQSGVYQGSIAVGGSALWRRSLRMVDSLFPGHVHAARLTDMLDVSMRAVVDVLRGGESSRVLRLDPVGTAALAEAVALRSGKGFFPVAGNAPPVPARLPEPLDSLSVVRLTKLKVAA